MHRLPFTPTCSSTPTHTHTCTPTLKGCTCFPRCRCLLTRGAGASLAWRVEVEGQANAMPLASYSPPTLHRAFFPGTGVTHADTQGGTVLAIVGQNLWDDPTYISVTITTPAGVTLVSTSQSACAFDVPHERLACSLPAGSGSISLVSVTVLGQPATLVPPGLAYAAPVVLTALPSTWPANVDGAMLTLTGRGFGLPSQSSLVTVTVRGVACGAVKVTLNAQSVTVRDDTELAFQVQGALDHVVPHWLVNVSVAGQVATTGEWRVPTRAPSAPALSFARVTNDTHYFVLMTGSDYGPAVGTSTCPGDVSVTIDGSPCDALTMHQVIAFV